MSQPQIATDPKDFGQLFLEGLKRKGKMRSFHVKLAHGSHLPLNREKKH
jgi:hypothetical protein